MEWYCRVDFTSPGQIMLVVAFNFRESESDKKTPGGKEVFGFNCKLGSSVRGGFIWEEVGMMVHVIPGILQGSESLEDFLISTESLCRQID